MNKVGKRNTSKRFWDPGTMVYPLPAVMVSCGDTAESYNIVTVSWTGTVCSDPAMAYISLRPSRYSYDIIKRTNEFVINVTTRRLAYATDFCGVRSGRDVNKFQTLKLTPAEARLVHAPLIKECPINIECRVSQVLPLGSHDMFLAHVLGVHVDEQYIDESDAFDLSLAEPISYSHGKYYVLGRQLGHFGYSVKKKTRRRR